MSPVTWPRVLIASDQIILSEQYKKLLHPEFQVVGIVTDEPALLAAVPELKPDVIVLDVGDSSDEWPGNSWAHQEADAHGQVRVPYDHH